MLEFALFVKRNCRTQGDSKPTQADPMSVFEKLKSGTVAGLIVTMIGLGLSYLVHVFAARIFGIEVYGDYLFILSNAVFFTFLAVAGFDAVLNRYIAEYRHSEQLERLQGVQSFAVRCVTVLSILAASLGITLTLMIEVSGNITRSVLILAAISVPCMAFSKINRATIQGLAFPVWAAVPDLILRHILFILFAIFLSIGFGNISLQTLVICHFGSYCIVTLVTGFWISLRPYFRQRRQPIPTQLKRTWSSMAAVTIFSSTSGLVLNQLDVWMLGVFKESSATGMYGAGMRIAALVPFGLGAINAAFSPLIARAISSTGDLKQLCAKAARYALLLGGPLAIGMMVYPGWFLTIFGPEFSGGTATLRVLVISQLTNVGFGSVALLLKMTGLHNPLAIILASSALLNGVLNLCLIPTYGPLGAAVATLVCTVVWNVAACLVVIQRLRVNPTCIPWQPE